MNFAISWIFNLFKKPEVKVVVPPKEDKDFFGLDRPVKKPVAKKKPAVKKPAAKKVVAKKATKVVKKAK
jgi:hypothetical protein